MYDVKKINEFTTAALFAGIVTLMIAGSSLPLGSLLLFVGVPSSMAVLSMRVRLSYALMAGAVSVFLSFFVLVPLTALFSLPFVVMGILAGTQLKRGESLYETAIFSAASSVVSLILFYLAIHVFHLLSPEEILRYVEMSLRSTYVDAVPGAAPETLGVLVDFVMQLMPAGLVFFHFLIALVCTTLTSGIIGRIGMKASAEPFTGMILRNSVKNMTITLTMVFFILFTVGIRNLFLLNVTALVFYMTGVVGIAGIIGLIFRPHKKKALILFGTLLMHIFIGPPALYFYAILDSHYDFRGVRKNSRG